MRTVELLWHRREDGVYESGAYKIERAETGWWRLYVSGQMTAWGKEQASPLEWKYLKSAKEHANLLETVRLYGPARWIEAGF